jgi:hypothetical protein
MTIRLETGLVNNRTNVPCDFSFTILIDNGSTIKNIAKSVQAGTLCCTEFGRTSLLFIFGIISLKVIKLFCSNEVVPSPN